MRTRRSGDRWGTNRFGGLGYGNTDAIGDDELPSSIGSVSLGGVATQIACGEDFTCALMESGSVRCWGRSGAGQGGNASTEPIGDDELPSAVGTVSLDGPVVQIDGNSGHMCALRNNGDVRCWGGGSSGQLGYGDIENVGDDEIPSSMDPVDIGADAIEVRNGFLHSCARLLDGGVRCWGRGNDGQLGHGNTESIGDDETPASAGNVPYL